MFFILFLIVIAAVYIISFRNDFTKEHIDKAGALVAIVSILILTLGILTSLV